MNDFRPYPLLDTSKHGVCNAKILSAYIPTSKSNLVLASGLTVRRKILEEGLDYQITHMPAAKDRIPGFRYIPIEGIGCACTHKLFSPLGRSLAPQEQLFRDFAVNYFSSTNQ